MRDRRKCVEGQEAGGCLDRNFSRSERPRVWGMLMHKEVTSMVTSRILDRKGMGKEQMVRK